MANYLDYSALQYYDTKLKSYMSTKDAEVLARAGVTIEQATTPTAGSAVTYIVYQNYTEQNNPTTKTKIEIGKIEIPLDHEVESGSLVVTPATQTDPAKSEIVMVMANTTDATTTSGKKEIRVDISTVAGDITAVTNRVSKLEGQVGKDKTVTAYESKSDLVDIVNVLTGADTVDGSVAKVVKTAIEGLDTAADIALASKTSDVVTIKGIKEVDGKIEASADTSLDVTLAKVASTGKAEDVSVATKSETATSSQAAWAIADTDVQAVLETLAKAEANDKAAIDKLNGTVTDDGSVLKAIKDNAKDAIYSAAVGTPGEDGYKAEVTIAQAIADAKSSATSASVVTVEKQATAETGYAASYIVKQNGTQVGAKINIPKDYLVKSGTLETCATADTPVAGLVVGDKYLDFVVNTVDNDETAQHIYLPVNDLFDSYTSGSEATDAIVVTVDNSTNKISAAITDGTIARAKVNAAFEADLKAIEDAVGYVDPSATTKVLQSVSDTVKKEAKDATYKAAVGSVGDADYTAAVTIAEAIKALEDSAKDTNGAFVMKGDVASLTALNAVADPKKGDAYYVTDIKSLYIRTDSAWKKLGVDGDFTLGNSTLNKSVDIKTYIDSRIFVGSAEEIATAKAAGTIDDTTFVVETDANAESFSPIQNDDIDGLFS